MDWNRNGANKAPPLTRSCDGLCSVRSEATTTLVLPNKPRRCTCGGKRRLHNQIRKYPTCTLTYRLIFVLIRWKACLASAGRLCCHDFTGNLRERSCSLQQPTLQQLTRISSSQRMSLHCCLAPPPASNIVFLLRRIFLRCTRGVQATNQPLPLPSTRLRPHSLPLPTPGVAASRVRDQLRSWGEAAKRRSCFRARFAVLAAERTARQKKAKSHSFIHRQRERTNRTKERWPDKQHPTVLHNYSASSRYI